MVIAVVVTVRLMGLDGYRRVRIGPGFAAVHTYAENPSATDPEIHGAPPPPSTALSLCRKHLTSA